jgi:hypothetical protein
VRQEKEKLARLALKTAVLAVGMECAEKSSTEKTVGTVKKTVVVARTGKVVLLAVNAVREAVVTELVSLLAASPTVIHALLTRTVVLENVVVGLAKVNVTGETEAAKALGNHVLPVIVALVFNAVPENVGNLTEVVALQTASAVHKFAV